MDSMLQQAFILTHLNLIIESCFECFINEWYQALKLLNKTLNEIIIN